jgi:hypothetical protein
VGPSQIIAPAASLVKRGGVMSSLEPEPVEAQAAKKSKDVEARKCKHMVNVL